MILAVAISGCGPRLVDPGPAAPRMMAPAPGASPQYNGPVFPAQPPLGTGSVPRVPASSVTTIPESEVFPSARYHSVQKGDTLTAIARRHGTTVAKLLEANGLDADAIIHPGQMIYIPE
ncbi:MAG TPA: LysM peptidoglycan-binding domain-containing protein [Planctomycetaceae bacterium]|nr:LysM peptidoglycan-binding domain-containing protein [Planctomycetaceae bacterium]